MYDRILNDNPEYPSYLSESAITLMKGMLEKNPQHRLEIKEIKKHQFFSGLSWEDLLKKKIPTPNPLNLRVNYFDPEYTSISLAKIEDSYNGKPNIMDDTSGEILKNTYDGYDFSYVCQSKNLQSQRKRVSSPQLKESKDFLEETCEMLKKKQMIINAKLNKLNEDIDGIVSERTRKLPESNKLKHQASIPKITINNSCNTSHRKERACIYFLYTSI